MKRATLAVRLIGARNNTERKRLLAAHPAAAGVRLARQLKENCYRVWTSEPAQAKKTAAALKALADHSPNDEILALHRWVEGIADITQGKLESAITNLDAASKLLTRLGREHESAQPQVAKLIALAMLGRYESAQRTGERALAIFGEYDDQLAAGKIEMNLSNIVSRRDQYRLAEKYCQSAHRRFAKLGERSWQTMAENGLANTYAELNDFERAEEFYNRALKNARTSRMTVTVAEIEASMGNLALFRGRYGDAIRLLELSRQKYEKLAMPHQTAIAELEIADIYAELNLTTEAIELYLSLVPRLRRLKMRAEEARARANLGRSLASADNPRPARSELKRAADLFNAEGNLTAFAATRIRLASLEMAQGKLDEALEILNDANATLEKSENVRLRISALWLRGELLAKLNRMDEAQSILDDALEKAVRYEQPNLARAAMNSLGMIACARGDSAKAESMFSSAIEAAEAARAPLPGEEFRMAFLAKSLEPFTNLTRLYLDQGDIQNAFKTVERARSRSLLEAIGGSSSNRSSGATTAKLREELNWLYARDSRDEDVGAAKLQKQILDREKQLARLALRQQGTSIKKRERSAESVDLPGLQKLLGKRTALVEFVSDAGSYSAFVVTDSSVAYFPDIATEKDILELLEGLHFQFGTLRFSAQIVGAFADQLKSRADTYLQRLYEKLARPLIESIGTSDLIVVPAGALNYVPFHALHDGERYMIESRDVAYAPSASVWHRLRSRRPRPISNALLMAYADERIPLVEDEIRRLEKTLPNVTRLRGKRASFSAFQELAGSFDLVHLACHGQFRPDNPMFSSIHLADGWVTVRDVVSNRLQAQLVTLSACETGLNKVLAGEEILGLARGFLSAGAGSLLLSLWTVNDAAASRLMEVVYANLQRGEGVSASLAIVQREFIERGEHPYYWSPFFVIG